MERFIRTRHSVSKFLNVTFTLFFAADDPKPCKYGDSECLIKAVQYFMKEKYEGDSAINLIKIDPLEVNKVVIKQGADSPVSIDLVFTKNFLYGINTTKVVNVR